MKSKATSVFSLKDTSAIKGIAIFMMIFHHCFYDPARFSGYEINFSPFSQGSIVAICNMFKICVPIFAFLSGYGLYTTLTQSTTSFRWIRTRLIKTLSGFWFVYVLVFIFAQLYAGYPQKIYFQNGFFKGFLWMLLDVLGLAHLLHTPSLLATWWYMGAAIIFILLLPIFVKWISKLGILSLFIGIIALPRIVGIGYPGGTSPYTFLTAFLLGVTFSKYNLFHKLSSIQICKSKNWNFCLNFILATFVLGIATCFFAILPVDSFWEYKHGIYPALLIYYLRMYLIRIPVINPILAFWGKHSMNVFLIHNFIRHTFFKDFIYGFKHFIFIAIVLFIISLLLSFCIIEPLKKISRYDQIIRKISS